jgi:uncharacterized OB-fold protein
LYSGRAAPAGRSIAKIAREILLYVAQNTGYGPRFVDRVTVDDETLVARFKGWGLDHDNRDHFRGRLDHQLLLNRCGDCGTWHHPPRPICPSCWSSEVVPTAVSGRGTVFLAIFLHQGPPADGVDYGTPYPVVTVELVEQAGLRFTGTVVGAANDEIRIGCAVALDWIDRGGVPVPAFRLRARTASR